jgi:hypothetical protein
LFKSRKCPIGGRIEAKVAEKAHGMASLMFEINQGAVPRNEMREAHVSTEFRSITRVSRINQVHWHAVRHLDH